MCVLIELSIFAIDLPNIICYNNIKQADKAAEGGDNINGFEFCRRRSGMTQNEAAAAIGVTQGTISMWENGQTYPTGERIKTVAEVYGSTIDELFEDDKSA